MPAVQDNVSDIMLVVRSYLHTTLMNVHDTPLNRTVVGNIGQPDGEGSDGSGQAASLDESLVLTLVRTEEDPTRKNQRNFRVNPLATDTGAHGIAYRTPPVGLNLYVLITANYQNYGTALNQLSNVIAVFQHRNRLTEATAAWPSDRLFSDKSLKFTLLSPTFEEENHLWSMLGGKQLPSVLYLVQTINLELVPDRIQTGPPVTEIILHESLS